MRTLGLRLGLAGVAAAALLALMLLAPVGGRNSAHAEPVANCDPAAPVPIPDLSKASVECTISNPGVIQDLNVSLDISHTWVGDLIVTLTHVDTGTSAVIIDRPGVPASGLGCSSDNILATLDDEAAAAAEDQCNAVPPALAGSLTPNNPLSVFDGESFAGAWTLSVSDNAGGDTGSINGWSLIASTNAIKKDPNLANLWLCQPVATCGLDSGSGVGERDFNVDLNGAITSISPKGEPQTIGSFEFEVRFDRKLVNVTVDAGELFDVEANVSCATTPGQGFVQFRCNVKGKDGEAITGPGTLAVVHVTPTADVYSMLIASQENGIATQLINQGCELSDLQGHPIASSVCGDADVTLRYLEGDVNADCIVDVRDQQEIAFRWDSHTGQLLYNSRLDLEPAAPKLGDGDIDGHDLQVVYGRHGSTCAAPHPAQDPVDPKATTVPPPV